MTKCPPIDPACTAGSMPAQDDPIDFLQRWESFGATWQIITRSDETIVVSLCRCDGGEEVDRLVSADPDVISWIASRADEE